MSFYRVKPDRCDRFAPASHDPLALSAVARLSLQERVLLGVTGSLLCVIGLSDVNSTPAARLLAWAAALCSALSPHAWMLFISASQVVPDPEGSSLTLAQMGVVAWCLTLPWNTSPNNLWRLPNYLRYVLPLAVWYYSVCFIARHEAPPALLYAMVIGLISYAQFLRAKVAWVRMLWCLVMGSLYSVFGYWGRILGIPVVAVSVPLAGAYVRTGTGRGDPNTTALGIIFFWVGTLVLVFGASHTGGLGRRRRVAWWVAALVSALSLPALLDTYSRTGLYGVALSLAGVTILAWRLPGVRRRVVAVGAGVAVAGLCWLAMVGGPDAAKDYWLRVQLRGNPVETQPSGSGILSGRSFMWSTYLRMILTHPFAGLGIGEEWDLGEYGVVRVGEDEPHGGCAHNVFLDFGAAAGVPGLVLFSLLFFGVPVRLTRRIGAEPALVFLGLLAPLFWGFMALSVGNWKPYWALLAGMIAAISAPEGAARREAISSNDERLCAGLPESAALWTKTT